MKILKVSGEILEQEIINRIVDYLNREKIIIYPTDTIYGLGCDATNPKAINRIYKIKKRNQKKPLIVLMKSWRMVKKYCFLSSKQDKYMHGFWPGPTTAILKKRDNLPNNLTGGGDSIAVRIPDNDFLKKILIKFNKPIVSTSANVSGKKPLQEVKKINKIKGIDLIIDFGKLKNKKPSQIIDIQDINNIKILRK